MLFCIVYTVGVVQWWDSGSGRVRAVQPVWSAPSTLSAALPGTGPALIDGSSSAGSSSLLSFPVTSAIHWRTPLLGSSLSAGSLLAASGARSGPVWASPADPSDAGGEALSDPQPSDAGGLETAPPATPTPQETTSPTGTPAPTEPPETPDSPAPSDGGGQQAEPAPVTVVIEAGEWEERRDFALLLGLGLLVLIQTLHVVGSWGRRG